jgi:hypothetical protein
MVNDFSIRLLKNSITALLALVLAAIWIWSFCFNFLIAYIWGVLLFILFLKFRTRIFSLRTFITYCLIYLLFLPFTLYQYQKRSAIFFQKIQQGRNLTFVEKSAVYGLNIVIGCLAYPIYPEVSKETLLMMFPADNGIRNFESDFFLKSDKIQQAIRSGKSRVSWSTKDYALGKKEARYALALNPCTLTVKTENSKTYYTVTVPIEYPEKLSVMLLSYPIQVTLEEGLFGYLQKAGWLHPYRAVWQFSE